VVEMGERVVGRIAKAGASVVVLPVKAGIALMNAMFRLSQDVMANDEDSIAESRWRAIARREADRVSTAILECDDASGAFEGLSEERIASIIAKAEAAQDDVIKTMMRSSVAELVPDVIEIVAADSGLPADYALRSAGGSILSSQPSYAGQVAGYMLHVGAAVARLSTGPAVPPFPKRPLLAITNDMSPGNAWCFDGHQASITIKLALPIVPRSFTVDHSATFVIDSAPRRFRVFAIPEIPVRGETLVAEFEYAAGPGVRHVQTFQATAVREGGRGAVVARAVRVDILENHGNPEFSCLYRFRVHAS